MPEFGVKSDATLCPYLFPSKIKQGVIVREDLELRYIHLFEIFPK